MSIVGHAEPLDYDIYARDGYYFGYSNAGFNALIAVLGRHRGCRAKRTALLQRIQRKLADGCGERFPVSVSRGLDGVEQKFARGIGFDNPLNTIDRQR